MRECQTDSAEPTDERRQCSFLYVLFTPPTLFPCRQARKLQEMFQKVQQENEMLRNGRRQAPGSASIAAQQMGQPLNNMLSPANNMHHQHRAPGSGRVVCTAVLKLQKLSSVHSMVVHCALCT